MHKINSNIRVQRDSYSLYQFQVDFGPTLSWILWSALQCQWEIHYFTSGCPLIKGQPHPDFDQTPQCFWDWKPSFPPTYSGYMALQLIWCWTGEPSLLLGLESISSGLGSLSYFNLRLSPQSNGQAEMANQFLVSTPLCCCHQTIFLEQTSPFGGICTKLCHLLCCLHLRSHSATSPRTPSTGMGNYGSFSPGFLWAGPGGAEKCLMWPSCAPGTPTSALPSATATKPPPINWVSQFGCHPAKLR